MLIVQVKEGETIDKALKKYKKKFEKAQILKILRDKQCFEKKSVLKRQQKLRAIHRQRLAQSQH